MKADMQEIMDKIVAKIAAMPQDEFEQLIEKYRNDPIALAIREMQEFNEFLGLTIL